MVDSPCKLTRDWAVWGVTEQGSEVPIGTYGCYAEARLAGSLWQKSTPGETTVHAERLYVPLTHEEYVDA